PTTPLAPPPSSTAPSAPGPSTPPPATPPSPPSTLGATPTNPVPAPGGTAAVRPQPGGAGAEESYQAAYQDFTRGRYPLAITGFREFLRRFPDSPLADSAQYGIGESYYSMATAASDEGQTDKAARSLEQAVQEFRKVTAAYPRGAKVPTAIYKE